MTTHTAPRLLRRIRPSFDPRLSFRLDRQLARYEHARTQYRRAVARQLLTSCEHSIPITALLWAKGGAR